MSSLGDFDNRHAGSNVYEQIREQIVATTITSAITFTIHNIRCCRRVYVKVGLQKVLYFSNVSAASLIVFNKKFAPLTAPPSRLLLTQSPTHPETSVVLEGPSSSRFNSIVFISIHCSAIFPFDKIGIPQLDDGTAQCKRPPNAFVVFLTVSIARHLPLFRPVRAEIRLSGLPPKSAQSVSPRPLSRKTNDGAACVVVVVVVVVVVLVLVVVHHVQFHFVRDSVARSP